MFLIIPSAVSRNVSELKEIPSKCLTCPIAIESADADVKPDMTGAEINPIREPVHGGIKRSGGQVT